ncbi:DUF3173 family protein [Companilactobacillus sp. HBUAS59699]|uniref:DUF3173 family protein n=1 Tax=Companilactobacillus sp. HBUAS59699 TaxID=3109358 RepID=UPI002FF3D4B0
MPNTTSNIMVTADDIETMGFKRGQAVMIVRQVKQIMVNRGFELYNNKRLGVVPKSAVLDLIGVSNDGDVKY